MMRRDGSKLKSEIKRLNNNNGGRIVYLRSKRRTHSSLRISKKISATEFNKKESFGPFVWVGYSTDPQPKGGTLRAKKFLSMEEREGMGETVLRPGGASPCQANSASDVRAKTRYCHVISCSSLETSSHEWTSERALAPRPKKHSCKKFVMPN